MKEHSLNNSAMSNIVRFSIFMVVIGQSNVCHSTMPFTSNPTRANLSAIVLIADGTEELEAVSTIDLLRRAEVRTLLYCFDIQ